MHQRNEVVINVRTPELKLIAVADRQVLNDVVLSKAISTRVIWNAWTLLIGCVAVDGCPPFASQIKAGLLQMAVGVGVGVGWSGITWMLTHKVRVNYLPPTLAGSEESPCIVTRRKTVGWLQEFT